MMRDYIAFIFREGEGDMSRRDAVNIIDHELEEEYK